MSRLDAFCALARELVLEQGLTQASLYKHIRKTLEEDAAKLPKARVAYNTAYGGYGYSEPFQKYVASKGIVSEDEDVKRHRQDVVPLFASYGEAMSLDRPDIAMAIHQYVQHGLEKAFQDIAMLGSYRANLDVARSNRQLLDTTESFGSRADPSRVDVIEKRLPTAIFTRESLEATIDDAIAYYEKYVQDTTAALEARFGAALPLMVASAKHLYPEEIANRGRPWYARTRFNEPGKARLDFAMALEHYSNAPWAAWECQEHLDKRAMRFLTEHPGALPAPEGDPPYELIGLLFATGAYACLAIAEVPQILDWTIHEYDGSESISVI